jgi:hypothetical protein
MYLRLGNNFNSTTGEFAARFRADRGRPWGGIIVKLLSGCRVRLRIRRDRRAAGLLLELQRASHLL